MNLTEMRTYVEILRRGSLTEAGRALGLTQSGVTRQLQRLEQDLGVSLLRRDTSPVSPTVAGERFATFAHKVLADFDVLRLELEAEAGHPSLRIAASTTPGEFIVPRLLVDLAKSYPGWRVRVDIMDSAQVVEQVVAGTATMGFVGSVQDHPSLQYSPFLNDELVLAVRSDHPLGDQETIAIEKLGNYPFILREEGSGTLRSLQSILIEQGRVLPDLQVVATLGSTQAVLSAILAGAGMGFVSARALVPYGQDRIRALRLSGLPLWRQLYLVVQNADRSATTTRFVRVALSWAAYQSSQTS